MKASVGLREMIQERMSIVKEWADQLKFSIEDKKKALEEARDTLKKYGEEYTELKEF